MKPAILLFDGVCNLCNASVNFIIDRDQKAIIQFGALQSRAGESLLAKFGIDSEKTDSLILIVGEKAYVRSSAALRVAIRLKFPWPLFGIFLVIPPFIRDVIYDFIARNRYKWFGKSDTCRIPTPELKSRFLPESEIAN